MSGKAPPKGPRALLLGSQPGSSGPASSSSSMNASAHTFAQHPQAHPPPSRGPSSSGTSNSTSRIGATPPTGPRSLQNNNHSRLPPPGPKHLVNGHSNYSSSSAPNGYISHSMPYNRHQVMSKGKNRDLGPKVGNGHSWQSSHPQNHINAEPNTNVSSNGIASSSNISLKPSPRPPSPPTPTERPGELKQDRPSVHIAIQPKLNRPPPQPDSPPPPPSYDPPPPPPPTHPPPPPPPPPTTEPEPEPQPPPLPPPELCPPPPPPPPLTPPPSLPPLAPPAPPNLPPPPLPPSTPEPPSQPPPDIPLPPPSPPNDDLPPPLDDRLSSSRSEERQRSPSPVIAPPTPVADSPPFIPRRRSSPCPPSRLSYSSSRESTSIQREPTEVLRSSEPRLSEPRPSEPALPPKPVFVIPSWPPPPSEYPQVRSFKVLFDPAVDSALAASSSHSINAQNYPNTRSSTYYKDLIEHVRKHGSEEVVAERIKGKGKGKEILTRFEGEVVGPEEPDGDMKEEEPVIRDPRKDKTVRRPLIIRSIKNEFIEVRYEYDENSTGPPPPSSILVTNISPLTPNPVLRRHFSQYGYITSFEAQIDKENGSALGIVFIKFQTHEEAKRCVERENGRKGGIMGAMMPKKAGDIEEWKVVFDGDSVKLKAVMKELEDRKRREREAKRKGPIPNTILSATPMSSIGTPHSGIQSPATFSKGGSNNSHPHPNNHNLHSKPPMRMAPSDLPPKPHTTHAELPVKMSDRVNDTLLKARAQAEKNHKQPQPTITKSKPLAPRNKMPVVRYNAYQATPLRMSRSPSPSRVRDPGTIAAPKSAADKEKERQETIKELAKNGFDHVKVQGSIQLSSVTNDSVLQFFEGFAIDKILRDHTGIYVTFPKAGLAHRTTTVFAGKTLGFQSVTLTVHPPPVYHEVVEKTKWEDDELLEEAQKMIIRELKVLLEKDISDRLVAQDLKKVCADEIGKRKSALGKEHKPQERKGLNLKGLSFKRKAKPPVVEVEKPKEQPKEEAKEVAAKDEEEEEEMEEEIEVERPKKKRKMEMVKKARRIIDQDDIESEEEDEDHLAHLATFELVETRKRSASPDMAEEEEEPVKKKQKVEVKVKGKKSTKKTKTAPPVKETVEEVILGESEVFESPAITQLRLDSTMESSLSPSRSPSPVAQTKRRKRPATPPPPPPEPEPEPVGLGLCDDDEDVYYAKLALSGEPLVKDKAEAPPSDSADVPTFHKHTTGSARTEGYYKITFAEKAAYVAQYQARTANAGAVPSIVDEPPPQHVQSSRSNRANARRRAQGLDELNQVQRAVALSKGETANELSFKFNQLQTRKKHLRFARSPIHDWGLYAMEKISRGEMVIEYVGEVIRAQVADKREKAYERQGIGSSYLFRIDEDLVVDATKKGNLGRLINHSCDPNCTAKIITISGEKKIVIYAKQDIELGDEITYDYHFPFEQDKIPCLCGSAKCRGFLN